MRGRYKWFQLFLYLSHMTLAYSGPMRNYTNGYHPAGGADPRYLNYDSGVVVPNLVNPRIPDPGISLTPRHHLEKYIGVRPGTNDYEYSEEYNEEYYDDGGETQLPNGLQADKTKLISPKLMTPIHYEVFFSDANSNLTVEEDVTAGAYRQAVGASNISYVDGSPAFAEYGSGENMTQGEVEFSVNRGKVHCRDGGRGYRSGDIFKVAGDPCTRCRCSRFGPQCNKTTCDPPPRGCFELMQRPDECCPVCLKMGCAFGGAIMSVNELLQITACETCECKENGRVDCSVADCTPPACVDAQIEVGQCCPVCPNGPNCYTPNNLTIRAGNDWVPVPDTYCTICRCRHKPGSQLLWMGNRTAQCKHDPQCEN